MSEINSELEKELPSEMSEEQKEMCIKALRLDELEEDGRTEISHDEWMSRHEIQSLRRWCVEAAIKAADAAKVPPCEPCEYVILYRQSIVEYASAILHFVKNG